MARVYNLSKFNTCAFPIRPQTENYGRLAEVFVRMENCWSHHRSPNNAGRKYPISTTNKKQLKLSFIFGNEFHSNRSGEKLIFSFHEYDECNSNVYFCSIFNWMIATKKVERLQGSEEREKENKKWKKYVQNRYSKIIPLSALQRTGRRETFNFKLELI